LFPLIEFNGIAGGFPFLSIFGSKSQTTDFSQIIEKYVCFQSVGVELCCRNRIWVVIPKLKPGIDHEGHPQDWKKS
jgi:hypothetical protein